MVFFSGRLNGGVPVRQDSRFPRDDPEQAAEGSTGRAAVRHRSSCKLLRFSKVRLGSWGDVLSNSKRITNGLGTPGLHFLNLLLLS
jgi:hypothetical protein